MRSPNPFQALVVILLAGGFAWLSGCSAPPRRWANEKVSKPRPAEIAGPREDYSPAAIEARTESHARFALAVLHDLNEEPNQAADEFFKAAMADLGNEELVIESGSRLRRLRKPEKAIEVLSKAAERPNASGALFVELGLAYATAGKRELAMDANRKAIKKRPGDFAGYRSLALLYLQNSQAGEGLQVLDEAAKQLKADAGQLIDLGETYSMFVRAGKVAPAKERAVDAFQRAAALKPRNPLLLQRIADGLNFLGESERASALYADLLKRLPQAPDVRERLIELLIRRQDYSNAIPHLRALAADNPSSALLNFQLGTLLFETLQPKEAVEYLKKALRFDMDLKDAYYTLAAAQLSLDQPNTALETLEKARKRFNPTFVGEYYSALASSHKELKNYTNALKFYASAEAIAREKETNRLTHNFYFQVGAAHERAHQFKEAEGYFRKALALSPDFAEALNYLGYMWAERGENLQEAHEMIEKAVKMEPKNAAFLDSLGWVLFKLDKPQEALKWIEKAIEHIEQPDATLYEHLGDILVALNKTAEARQAFQKAYAIEPSEQIQRKLSAASSSPAP